MGWWYYVQIIKKALGEGASGYVVAAKHWRTVTGSAIKKITSHEHQHKGARTVAVLASAGNPSAVSLEGPYEGMSARDPVGVPISLFCGRVFNIFFPPPRLSLTCLTTPAQQNVIADQLRGTSTALIIKVVASFPQTQGRSCYVDSLMYRSWLCPSFLYEWSLQYLDTIPSSTSVLAE